MNKLSEPLARQKTDGAEALHPIDECAAFLYLGNMYRKLGLLEQAQAEYRRAHAVHPSEETARAIATLREQISARKQSVAVTAVRRAA
jgi:uncharacterized protein HemY